ncbi:MULTISPECIES: hypothetical protein [Phyllobacteriaceae]|jgi:hypothetical protein|uniref:hypothetical protein n=1 Tax=Mesorhizobium TaxID=68287 RepID=UPI000464F552|nr:MULTISPECIES: hypothetical protein [Mesorhizobium]MBN9234360.1 hypothetical protein [Mesorhizobium sp.]
MVEFFFGLILRLLLFVLWAIQQRIGEAVVWWLFEKMARLSRSLSIYLFPTVGLGRFRPAQNGQRFSDKRYSTVQLRKSRMPVRFRN